MEAFIRVMESTLALKDPTLFDPPRLHSPSPTGPSAWWRLSLAWKFGRQGHSSLSALCWQELLMKGC